MFKNVLWYKILCDTLWLKGKGIFKQKCFVTGAAHLIPTMDFISCFVSKIWIKNLTKLPYILFYLCHFKSVENEILNINFTSAIQTDRHSIRKLIFLISSCKHMLWVLIRSAFEYQQYMILWRNQKKRKKNVFVQYYAPNYLSMSHTKSQSWKGSELWQN